MNKLLRILSTLAVAAGLALLFAYFTLERGVDRVQLLTQPSYSTLQSYTYLFFAAVGCLVFALLSSFFSWNRKLDTVVTALPNAVTAGKDELLGWLSGSSLDVEARSAAAAGKETAPARNSGMPLFNADDKPEPVREEEKTVPMQDDEKTEPVLYREMTEPQAYPGPVSKPEPAPADEGETVYTFLTDTDIPDEDSESTLIEGE